MQLRLLARWTTVVAAAGLTLLAGCGDANDSPSSAAPGEVSGGLQHIHGLGVSSGKLFIATHTGLWTAPAGQSKARRYGRSRQDVMGFSVLGGDHFVGSGHPAPSQTGEPPNLGLIESGDAGRSWRSVSLRGEVDFHVLETAGEAVYGVNSADGAVMASDDGGRTWKRRTPPPGVLSLAIDPRSASHIVVSTEQGLFSSTDGGRRWRPLRGDVAGLLEWPAAGRLYLVTGDGTVAFSGDGGRTWKPVGATGGQPAAFLAHGDDLYAALADNTVKRSRDGGRTWTLRARP